MTHPTRAATALALAVLCAPASGCGSGTATVSGTVTFQGKPLTSGSVALYCADKQILHALIDSAGRYSIPKVPLGAVRVTVQTHRKAPLGLFTAAQPPKMLTGDSPIRPIIDPNERPPMVIPYRYAHPEESGLSFVAAVAHQPFDIELLP